VVEDDGIKHWNIDYRKRNNEPSNNSPEEEAIIPDGMEDGKWTLVLGGI